MNRLLYRSSTLLVLILLTQAACNRVGPDTGPKGAGPSANRSLPLEPMPDHPRAELSNLRFERGPTGNERFSVDWRVTKQAPVVYQMTLAINRSNGPPMTRPVGGTDKTSGTVSAEILSNRPAGQQGPTLEDGCEMYIEIQQYGNHKISNSVTSGNASVTPTRPRTP